MEKTAIGLTPRKLPDGVYIHDLKKELLYRSLKWHGEDGYVVVLHGNDAFGICRSQIELATWQEALDFAAKQGGNLPTKLQRLIMEQYAPFINHALGLTGGLPLNSGIDDKEWLCQPFFDAENSWYYQSLGCIGYCHDSKRFSGRPVLPYPYPWPAPILS
jgi:hypothetical protein